MQNITIPLPTDASLEQRLTLRHLRERTYLPDAQSPYHGISHPDKVWSKAEILMERCAHYGIPVDGEALRHAIELHDAFSHMPARMLGYESAESLAAAFTYRLLIESGYSQSNAAKVHDIIMATNPDIHPETPEEIIIRAADLWNIGSTFDEFKEGSLALHQEAQLANRMEIPFGSWLRGAFLYLERFMWPMLELTPEAKDTQGRSVFHANAMRNMATLWRDTFGEHTPVTVEFFASGKITPSPQNPQEFYIAIHPQENRRKESLPELAGSALACNGAALAVPGARGAFPLPDEFCSRVICHDPCVESLREALRITRRGGTVILDLPDNTDPRLLEIAQAFQPTVCFSPDGAATKTLIMRKEAAL
jgi:hypothetical protein